MSDEQINAAITEAIDADPHWKCAKDYCNDLNAMHEAEKRMRSGDWTRYCQYLAEYGGGTVRFVSVHATAQSRAKAFLKTIGKWEGAK
jgi:hypothetical protein